VAVQAKGKKGGRVMARFFCGVFFVVCFLAAGQAGAGGWSETGWNPVHVAGMGVNRQGLIEEIASYKKIPVYDAEKEWEQMQYILSRLMINGNSIKVRGWGDWNYVKVEARMYRNPQSGLLNIKVPAYNTVKWSIGSTLKTAIKDCYSKPNDCIPQP
jgi:nucleoid DNA-binding protein